MSRSLCTGSTKLCHHVLKQECTLWSTSTNLESTTSTNFAKHLLKLFSCMVCTHVRYHRSSPHHHFLAHNMWSTCNIFCMSAILTATSSLCQTSLALCVTLSQIQVVALLNVRHQKGKAHPGRNYNWIFILASIVLTCAEKKNKSSRIGTSCVYECL